MLGLYNHNANRIKGKLVSRTTKLPFLLNTEKVSVAHPYLSQINT